MVSSKTQLIFQRWGNSWHLATPPLLSLRNDDVWITSANFHTDEICKANVISMEFLRVLSWGNQSRRREMSVVFSSYTKGLICWCTSVIKGPLTWYLRPNAFNLSPARAHHPGTATAGKTSLKWIVLSRSAFHLHCYYSYSLIFLKVVVCHAIRLDPPTCQICNRKHDTSLRQERIAYALLIATGIPTTHVTYPRNKMQSFVGHRCRKFLCICCASRPCIKW